MSRILVKVKYYAWLASLAGTSEDLLEVQPGVSIEDVLKLLSKMKPSLSKVIDKALKGEAELVILHNLKHPAEGLKTKLSNNDVLEILPPMSGGTSALLKANY